MNLSMRWLKDYVPVDKPMKEYVADLTMSGSKVESYHQENQEIKNVLVGKVLSVDKHPNADSLVICKIDVGGEEPLQIVTGAKNVVAGAMVPVACDRSMLPGGKEIRKGKLRGELSQGMLCSLSELGLTQSDFPYAIEDGIFLLEEECYPGQEVPQAIGLDDTIVEFEITSNRPDCLSVIGLARETAATYHQKFLPPVPTVHGGGTPLEKLLSVEVEDTQTCLRYCAAAVENVKIGPSPRWMRERLRASGVRPINNIVDITNFVMLEYGQPMHAFDLRHVNEQKIVVRKAKQGETITTLDEVERSLSSNILVIADAKGPSAVAGVMGGEYSGVYEDTSTVIFESACFDGASVRRAAKELGMRTESSGRFEKGLDSRNCLDALKRACQLVEELGIGTVCTGMIDKDYDQKPLVRVPFESAAINRLIGVDISREAMSHILNHLGFTIEENEIISPAFRVDIAGIEDIAEEVARIYGYNKIPTQTLRGEARGVVSDEQKLRRRIGNVLLGQGYSEIKTFTFFGPRSYDRIRLPQDSALRNSVVIRNPLGEDTSVMRTTAIPSMLEVLATNYNNRNESASLFELVVEFLPQEGQLPVEPTQVMLGQYGKNCDFFHIKGAMESILQDLGIQQAEWMALSDDPTFHPGRCGVLMIDGNLAGVVGQIHPLVAEDYEIGVPVYLARIDYTTLYQAANLARVYKSLPRFPASTRDLSLVCPETMPAGTIEKTLKASVGSILEKVELFDIYRGAQIGEGQKSLAYALTLRSADHTLTVEECDKAVQKALKALNLLGVSLRG